MAEMRPELSDFIESIAGLFDDHRDITAGLADPDGLCHAPAAIGIHRKANAILPGDLGDRENGGDIHLRVAAPNLQLQSPEALIDFDFGDANRLFGCLNSDCAIGRDTICDRAPQKSGHRHDEGAGQSIMHRKINCCLGSIVPR
jgi:hypothetical protein